MTLTRSSRRRRRTLEELGQRHPGLNRRAGHAAAGQRRLDAVPDAPDIAGISSFEPETGEVSAFEELIGSHGGMGGPQTAAFLMIPSQWRPPGCELVGAPAIYREMRTWLAAIGLGPGAP